MSKIAAAAVALLVLVAVAEAQTAAPFAGRKAAGAYCRHSCYSGPGVTSCKGAVETKTKVLTLSKIPFKVEGSDCTTEKTTGCAVLMLQSWPSKADHDKFQIAEDTVKELKDLRVGLPSAKPTGLSKDGPCAGFKSPIV